MRRFSRVLLATVLMLFATVAMSGDVKKGWKAYNSLDYAAALAEWQEPADAGDVMAAFGMGMLYSNGFGVDMNDDLALKYYGIAAEAGHADAQFNLAVMHQNGWGVPQDEVAANKWFALAADQGNVEAQMALGRYYAMDFSDTYDPVQAYKWFTLAQRLGNIDATEKSEFIASRMTPEQLAAGKAQVDAWASGHPKLFRDY